MTPAFALERVPVSLVMCTEQQTLRMCHLRLWLSNITRHFSNFTLATGHGTSILHCAVVRTYVIIIMYIPVYVAKFMSFRVVEAASRFFCHCFAWMACIVVNVRYFSSSWQVAMPLQSNFSITAVWGIENVNSSQNEAMNSYFHASFHFHNVGNSQICYHWKVAHVGVIVKAVAVFNVRIYGQ